MLRQPLETTEPVRVHIRWMIQRDLPEVLVIDAATSQAWGEDEIRQRLRSHNCIGMVAELGETIVGFMVYELHKHHLLLNHFGVHPQYRQRSIGSQMIYKLYTKLSSHRRTSIKAEVAETDLEMLLFLKQLGWRAVRVQKGVVPRVDDNWDLLNLDAYVMQYRHPRCIDEDESETGEEQETTLAAEESNDE